MIRFSALKTALALCLTVLSVRAFAEPADSQSFKLTRNAKSELTMIGTLSKNLYRAEEYQAEYTVQIPYEVEEEYTVEIPYIVNVPYTEYVTDYRSEYVCHDVTKYRSEYVCHDVTKYRNEYSCHDVTNYRQECHNEVQCYLVPGTPTCHEVSECGTNVQGEPICKTRTVCEDGSSTQRCEDHQVCQSVPYTDQQCSNTEVPYTDRECSNEQVPYTDNECGYEQVPYQREVSGFRDETRYRTETRTHMVTKYREETRCCETKTRQVFDKQLQYQVSVHFPQNAVLGANDKEEMNINLDSATVSSAQVSLQSVDTIWGYSIKSQTVTGATIDVVLEAKAQFDASNAGEASIKNAVLNWAPTVNYFQFSFIDSVKSSKVKTTFKVSLLDDKGKVLDEQKPVADANGQVNFLFKKPHDKKAGLKAVLQVTRTSNLLAGGTLNFQMEIQSRPVQ